MLLATTRLKEYVTANSGMEEMLYLGRGYEVCILLLQKIELTMVGHWDLLMAVFHHESEHRTWYLDCPLEGKMETLD